jgi:hypothetical protein
MTEDPFNREQKAFWKEKAMTEKGIRLIAQKIQGLSFWSYAEADNAAVHINSEVVELTAYTDQQLAELKREIWDAAREGFYATSCHKYKSLAEYYESKKDGDK